MNRKIAVLAGVFLTILVFSGCRKEETDECSILKIETMCYDNGSCNSLITLNFGEPLYNRGFAEVRSGDNFEGGIYPIMEEEENIEHGILVITAPCGQEIAFTYGLKDPETGEETLQENNCSDYASEEDYEFKVRLGSCEISSTTTTEEEETTTTIEPETTTTILQPPSTTTILPATTTILPGSTTTIMSTCANKTIDDSIVLGVEKRADDFKVRFYVNFQPRPGFDSCYINVRKNLNSPPVVTTVYIDQGCFYFDVVCPDLTQPVYFSGGVIEKDGTDNPLQVAASKYAFGNEIRLFPSEFIKTSTTTIVQSSTTSLLPTSTTSIWPTSTTSLWPTSTTIWPTSSTTVWPTSTTSMRPTSTTTVQPPSTTTVLPVTTTILPVTTTTVVAACAYKTINDPVVLGVKLWNDGTQIRVFLNFNCQPGYQVMNLLGQSAPNSPGRINYTAYDDSGCYYINLVRADWSDLNIPFRFKGSVIQKDGKENKLDIENSAYSCKDGSGEACLKLSEFIQ